MPARLTPKVCVRPPPLVPALLPSYDLTLPARGVLKPAPQSLQFFLTTGQVSGHSIDGGRGNGRHALRHGSDKPVASAMKCFNEGRILGLIAQRATELRNVNLQVLLLHIDPRPHGLHQLFLGDQSACMFDEVACDGEGFAGQGNSFTPSPQAFVDGIEPEGMEVFHRTVVSDNESPARAALALSFRCRCSGDVAELIILDMWAEYLHVIHVSKGCPEAAISESYQKDLSNGTASTVSGGDDRLTWFRGE